MGNNPIQFILHLNHIYNMEVFIWHQQLHLPPPPLKKKQKTTKQKNNRGHSHYYSQQKLKFLFIRKRLLKIYEKPFVNFDFEIDNPF